MKMMFIKIAILLTVTHFVKNTSAANITGYIQGGQFSKIKEFPHSVRLIMMSTYKNDGWACGASILNQAILLTAAHCVEDQPERIMAFVGAEKELQGALYLGSFFIAHKQYDPVTVQNDIALIKLKSEMKLGEKVGRVVLMRYPPYDEISFVAGWGSIEKTGPFSTYLKHISQVIYNREQCHKLWKIEVIPIGHFCAVNRQKLGTVLGGDSGSALVVRHYIQIGKASFIYLSLDNSTTVASYVDTGFFYDWIHEKAKDLFCRNNKTG